MTSIRVPGKVMLSGEYGVLAGATAAMAPVPRYLTLEEPGGTPLDDLPQVLRDVLRYPIPELAEFEREHLLQALSIVNRDFFPEGETAINTLGIGLSSAEAAAAVKLRFSRKRSIQAGDRIKVAEIAMRAHREAQGGIGSGADVAVCVWGKPILFNPGHDGFQIEEFALPQTPKLSLLWTGHSADTRKPVKRFLDWMDNADQSEKDLVKEFVRTANLLAPLWGSGDRGLLLPALEEFETVRDRCLEAAGIEIRLRINHQVEETARQHGGRAKPVGAGGGDVILLIGEFPTDLFEGFQFPLN